jgi:hypothetical protein
VDDLGIPSGKMITFRSIVESNFCYDAPYEKIKVKDASEEVDQFTEDDEISYLLQSLKNKNAVLIINNVGSLIGIVTTFDTTKIFQNLSEDILYVEKIEFKIKELINLPFIDDNGEINENDRQKLVRRITNRTDEKRKLYEKALKSYLGRTYGNSFSFNEDEFMRSFIDVYGDKNIKSFDDLTLDDYVKILTFEEVWKYFSDAFDMDLDIVVNMLDNVRKTRNDLAHFRPILPDQKMSLRTCLDKLDRVYQEILK